MIRFALLAVFPALLCAAPQPLFNGKDLSGWVQEGRRPSFFVENGELRTSGRGEVGNWIRTAREYEDFRLSFDYKLAQWTEAAAMVRVPRTDRPQPAGLSLMLAHDFHNEITPWVTGGLGGVLSPKTGLKPSFEQWHHVEIEAVGRRYKASIDGILMQDLSLDSTPGLEHRLRRGYIGFPDMSYPYALRNLMLEDLGAPTPFVELGDGRSLDGWEKRGNSGEWWIRDGVITGANGHSTLYAAPPFDSFELTAVVRSHNRVNSGIFLRGQPTGDARGFEVQIYSPVDAVYPTGSIYGKKRSAISADLEERWFLLQIRVEGKRCRVWLDGELAAEYENLPPEYLHAGRIGLQIHKEDSSVDFRDLHVRPLTH
jgi:hypothetical protein